jgi:hypothetical protein
MPHRIRFVARLRPAASPAAVSLVALAWLGLAG